MLSRKSGEEEGGGGYGREDRIIAFLTIRKLRITIIEGVNQVKRKDVIRKLEAAGYRLDRTGDHAIYEKPGNRSVQVPNHREINEYTAKAILKVAGIE